MLSPIIACVDPYETAELYKAAGWRIDFSSPPESGDSLVEVSLYDNSVLLGVTEGYVDGKDIPSIGNGVVYYITVPMPVLKQVHEDHRAFFPTDICKKPWGDTVFEVAIAGHRYMIAGQIDCCGVAAGGSLF